MESETRDKLEALFRAGYTSKARLWEAVKREHPAILKREVDEFIKERKAKPSPKRNSPGTKGYTGISGPWAALSMDIFMEKRALWLTVVDIFSGFAWMEPIADRQRATVLKAFTRVASEAPTLVGTRVFCDRDAAWTPETEGDSTLPWFHELGIEQVFVEHAVHAESLHKRLRETIRDAGKSYSRADVAEALQSLNESPSKAAAGYTPEEALAAYGDGPEATNVRADIQEHRARSVKRRERENTPDAFEPGERVIVEPQGPFVKRSRGDAERGRVWLVDRVSPNYYHLIAPDGTATKKAKREQVRPAP